MYLTKLLHLISVTLFKATLSIFIFLFTNEWMQKRPKITTLLSGSLMHIQILNARQSQAQLHRRKKISMCIRLLRTRACGRKEKANLNS